MALTNTLLGLLGLTGATYAACSNLLIDDFSRQTPSGLNSLSSWTSDDNSMSSIVLANGVLSFTPKPDSSSYFYETLDCYRAATQGYKALSLTVKGPKDASFMVEIQTKQACTDKEYKSQWVVISGLTGSTQTVSIALSSFPDANLDGITGFVWSTYSQFSGYQFSNIQLTCNEGTTSSPLPISSTASIKSSLSASQPVPASASSTSSTCELILHYIGKVAEYLIYLDVSQYLCQLNEQSVQRAFFPIILPNIQYVFIGLAQQLLLFKFNHVFDLKRQHHFKLVKHHRLFQDIVPPQQQ
ncbi:uncharacterized protein ColSpa_10421 [Colletotrichum spaethianum]|uniref:Uncharacterized protein n=1 Tax=Colletotrichum spaethianum TaxID=700344 RepID=A0AA37PDF3_9PEZI|nr:uncharacterized protein ColSpa_10421 [Colletotrichum spaethianum]GKT50240.1 hypothetical protein ColSpa_10421 [Colletotrichum spaethianum]